MISTLSLFLADYGTYAIMGLIALEYLGLPLPTELAYIAAHQNVVAGNASYAAMFSVIVLAHVVGCTFSYEVGYRASALARETKEFSGLQRRLMKWYAQYGPIIILLAQLVGHVRPWASYIAGFSRVKRQTFFLYNIAGSALLTALMLAIAEQIMHFWQSYPWFRVVTLGMFAVIILILAVSLVRKFLRKRDC